MTRDGSLLFEADSLPRTDARQSVRPRVQGRGILRVSRELELGRAAEHLVCADLLLSGWSSYPTAQGLPYDLAVDLGHRIVRVQVKSSFFAKNPQPTSRANPAYFYQIRRAGRGGARVYGGGEFDIYALVALDRRLIAYFAMAELPCQSVVVRVPGGYYGHGAKTEREFEGSTFERALRVALEIEASSSKAAARGMQVAA
ncbi:hypothetical protein DFH01_23815 [Falsiroseomonas bella]|uniref:PD(D/E)XK endonuclease domain-containing protein n=1 Tax=Falsiroseomonas bella TaxID=2184016 RepID=A0A317F5V2_9PROT|nr:group I intron-associated PD-(D/E)XK endonuclease [Falsiroseomonas bella]PWS34571.1 hypothetical protein DFH01_23815 [Falsiroseomonas bella]